MCGRTVWGQSQHPMHASAPSEHSWVLKCWPAVLIRLANNRITNARCCSQTKVNESRCRSRREHARLLFPRHSCLYNYIVVDSTSPRPTGRSAPTRSTSCTTTCSEELLEHTVGRLLQSSTYRNGRKCLVRLRLAVRRLLMPPCIWCGYSCHPDDDVAALLAVRCCCPDCDCGGCCCLCCPSCCAHAFVRCSCDDVCYTCKRCNTGNWQCTHLRMITKATTDGSWEEWRQLLEMTAENRHHEDSAMSIPGYSIFRRDRRKRKGGGLAIYVKHGISARVFNQPGGLLRNDAIELLWVVLEINGRSCYVGAVYHPPKPIYLIDDLILH